MSCLACGFRSAGIHAEHALYETGDGRQGMGARQCGDVWAIIPACPSCNYEGVKRLNAYAALMTGEALGKLTEPQQAYLGRLKTQFAEARFDGVRRRAAHWAEKLREAGA